MSPETALITEDTLHAYVDGQLPEPHRTEVESLLAANPQDAERVRAYQKQNEALRALFDPILDEVIPSHLRLLKSRRYSTATRCALIAVCLVVGSMLGWIGRGANYRKADEPLTFARQAALAHLVYTPEVRHPVEVAAEQEDHLVNWLSKRLGAPLKAPHLSKLGYDMVGGRLLPGNKGPVAQFMYQDQNGQRLTLYVRTDTATQGETAFRFSEEGKVKVFYWLDRPFDYALTGEVERGELLRIAKAIYQELNP